jgi:hypothetical protein
LRAAIIPEKELHVSQAMGIQSPQHRLDRRRNTLGPQFGAPLIAAYSSIRFSAEGNQPPPQLACGIAAAGWAPDSAQYVAALTHQAPTIKHFARLIFANKPPPSDFV